MSAKASWGPMHEPQPNRNYFQGAMSTNTIQISSGDLRVKLKGKGIFGQDDP